MIRFGISPMVRTFTMYHTLSSLLYVNSVVVCCIECVSVYDIHCDLDWILIYLSDL